MVRSFDRKLIFLSTIINKIHWQIIYARKFHNDRKNCHTINQKTHVNSESFLFLQMFVGGAHVARSEAAIQRHQDDKNLR